VETPDDDELGKLGGQRESAEASAAIRRWLKLARRVLGEGEDETTSRRDRRSFRPDERPRRR